MDEPFTLSEEQRYQLYLEERKILVDAWREGARSFDKAILTLASGAFGFTIAFLKEIVPHPSENTLWLLATSWAMFALSLVVILFAFIASQNACRLQIDLTYDDLMFDKKQPNKWTMVTRISNYAAVTVLAFAFVFWGCFVYWNVIHK